MNQNDPNIVPGQEVEVGPDEGLEGGGIEVIEALPELQNAPEGHECRVEVTVVKSADGISLKDAKYLAQAGGKTRDEYLKMKPEERDTYDAGQVLGTK